MYCLIKIGMKKLQVIAASAIVAVSACVFAYSEIKTDDLFYANVGALADNEGSNYTCESKITSGDRNTFFCGSCDWVYGSKPTWDCIEMYGTQKIVHCCSVQRFQVKMTTRDFR